MARWPRQDGKKTKMKGKAMSISRPYFFKVLVRTFIIQLMVPPAFVKNFKASFPTKVRAGSPPITWNVKVKIKQGRCYLVDGWEMIVRDLDLKFGDFLVFRLVTDDVLEVVAFDRTCCEKKFDMKSKGTALIEGDDCAELILYDVDDSDEDEEERRPPLPSRALAMTNYTLPSTSKEFRCISYLKTLAKHEMMILCLPTRISNPAGQWTRESALIRNSKGQEWLVVLKVRNNKKYHRVDFSTGWRYFVRDNGLLPGDTIRLDFKGGRKNRINAVVLRKH